MAHEFFSLKYVNGNKRKQLTKQLLIHKQFMNRFISNTFMNLVSCVAHELIL